MTDDFRTWQAAVHSARLLDQRSERRARLAIAGSYTTGPLADFIWLAAHRLGIELEIYEAPFGQYGQEVADPGSGLYAFGPDYVLLAVDAAELGLPAYSVAPDELVDLEVARWRAIWRAIGARSGATVVQHLFVAPPEAPYGNLTPTLPGTRASMVNAASGLLAATLPPNVAVVDCERLASLVGKRAWFDSRYSRLAGLPIALDCLPLLARHTAAVIAARAGLSRKCLALDLDGTLWRGIIGEDGLGGIQPNVDFQEAVLALRARGVVLAVCSKNNESDALLGFSHPDMRIKVDDVAVLVADWQPKHHQLQRVADEIGIGVDAIAFVDDNPAERSWVRAFAPDVDVIELPIDPARYVEALDDYLGFEPAAFTTEDAGRNDSYRSRTPPGGGGPDDYYASLEMRCTVSPFTEADLPRLAQLAGKTNQFNLTTRRHSAAAIARFAADPSCVHLSFRLADRYADHGLVAMAIAVECDGVLEIDSWLMSCRVIGRTLEQTMLSELARAAAERDCILSGSYVPSGKNELVRDLLERLGFNSDGLFLDDPQVNPSITLGSPA